MKKKIITGVVVAVLLIGFLSLFPHKMAFKETVSVCTQEGETATVEFDVVLWKYWYMQDSLKGSVTVDGVRYEHLDYERYGAKSRSFLFAVPKGDMLERLDNSLEILLYGKDFEGFSIMPLHNEDAELYYGPAETAEDAEMIIKSIID